MGKKSKKGQTRGGAHSASVKKSQQPNRSTSNKKKKKKVDSNGTNETPIEEPKETPKVVDRAYIESIVRAHEMKKQQEAKQANVETKTTVVKNEAMEPSVLPEKIVNEESEAEQLIKKEEKKEDNMIDEKKIETLSENERSQDTKSVEKEDDEDEELALIDSMYGKAKTSANADNKRHSVDSTDEDMSQIASKWSSIAIDNEAKKDNTTPMDESLYEPEEHVRLTGPTYVPTEKQKYQEPNSGTGRRTSTRQRRRVSFDADMMCPVTDIPDPDAVVQKKPAEEKQSIVEDKDDDGVVEEDLAIINKMYGSGSKEATVDPEATVEKTRVSLAQPETQSEEEKVEEKSAEHEESNTEREAEIKRLAEEKLQLYQKVAKETVLSASMSEEEKKNTLVETDKVESVTEQEPPAISLPPVAVLPQTTTKEVQVSSDKVEEIKLQCQEENKDAVAPEKITEQEKSENVETVTTKEELEPPSVLKKSESAEEDTAELNPISNPPKEVVSSDVSTNIEKSMKDSSSGMSCGCAIAIQATSSDVQPTDKAPQIKEATSNQITDTKESSVLDSPIPMTSKELSKPNVGQEVESQGCGCIIS